MSSSVWGARGRIASSSSSTGSSSSSSSSSGSSSGSLCVIGTACRFGSNRESASEGDSRLIKIKVDGEEVFVDRYDVRLLLGDVSSFARQNCSEERRLAELEESPEIEDMRYEDLPRRSAFSDDLPSPKEQQQEQQQWTPTLEQQQQDQQQQRKKQRTMSAAAISATPVGEEAPTPEGVYVCPVSSADYSAVPPPDSLDAVAGSGAASDPTTSPVSDQRERGAAVAAGTKEEEAEGPPSEDSSCGAAGLNAQADQSSQQNPQQPGKQQEQQGSECFVPPFPDLPAGICLPENLKEYLVVERTAHFVREEGERMEFRLLLDKESRLPFLSSTHRLYPFYTWLKKQGHSLVTRGAALLPARVKALLEFAYSLGCTADLNKQQQEEQKPQQQNAEVKNENEETQVQQQKQKQQTQQQQLPKHDPDGGLGLLLSYGSDEEEDDAASPQQQPKEEEEQKQQQQQQQEQQQQDGTEQQQCQTKTQEGGSLKVSPPPPPPLKKKPPPAPPFPSAKPAASAAASPAATTAAAGDDGSDDQGEESEDSEDDGDTCSDSKDLTAMWRSLRVTRFSLTKKRPLPLAIDREEGPEEEDIDIMMDALPKKAPWAQPNNKLGLSKASALSIQQLGHQLLSAGDLSLVQHAKTYEDDASSFPFLRTSSMDLRYFRYVLKCVETEIQKHGFIKPKPLPGPTHELARSFMARLQLDHHLQQRKQKLLEECKRLSGETQENQALDYLKRVEVAAAGAPAAGVAGSGANKSCTDNAAAGGAATAAAAAAAATPAVAAGAAAAHDVGAAAAPAAELETAAADPATGAYYAASQSQLPPETAAHLQMLVQQMAAASAADDAATYMACYTAYCYALAGLSPEAAAAATAATAAATAAASTATTAAATAATTTAAAAATTVTAAPTVTTTPLDVESVSETPQKVAP